MARDQCAREGGGFKIWGVLKTHLQPSLGKFPIKKKREPIVREPICDLIDKYRDGDGQVYGWG